MKKKILRKLTLLAAFTILSAAKNTFAQTANYQILRDAPENVSDLQLRWHLMAFEGFRTNVASFGGGLEARYNWNNKLLFGVNNWFSYSTIADNANSKKFVLREVNAGYALLSKKTKGDVKIILSESVSRTSSGTYSSTKYITVPGNTYNILAVTGGAFFYKTPFKLYQLKKTDLSRITDTSGVGLSGFSISGSSLKAYVLSAGLSFNKIFNTQILVNGRSKRSAEKWLNTYANLLYAPVIEIDDFVENNQDGDVSYFIMSDATNGIEKQHLGWRAGLVGEWHVVKRITFSGRCEAGSRPGIKNNGLYLRCGIGMTVNLF